MPQRDGKGPEGKGPQTGRKQGSCVDPKKPKRVDMDRGKFDRYLDE